MGGFCAQLFFHLFVCPGPAGGCQTVGRVPPGAAVSSNISKQHRRVLSTSRCIARGGRLVGCTGRAGAAETGEKPAPASSPGRAPACRLARAQPTQRDCPGRGAPRRRAAAARAVDRAPGARPSGGRRFVWLARCLLAHAVLIAALTLPARFSAAAPHQFTSADGGYSVTFPAAPQEQMNEDERARTVLNALNYDNGYFAVVHVDARPQAQRRARGKHHQVHRPVERAGSAAQEEEGRPPRGATNCRPRSSPSKARSWSARGSSSSPAGAPTWSRRSR